MRSFKIRKDSLWFTAILLLIITYPFNRQIISFLRTTDILFLLFFSSAFFAGALRANFVIPIGLLFFISLFVSSWWGITFHKIDMAGFAFYYKYFSFFFLLWFVLSAKLSQRQLRLLCKFLGFSFAFLVFYVFYYHYMLISGVPLPKRPDFPLSNKQYFSAGHLYGAYLSTGLSALFSYYLFFVKKHRFLWFLMLLLSIIALILTGSRAPVIAIGVGLFILLTACLFQTNRKVVLRFCIILAMLIVAMTVMTRQFYVFDLKSGQSRVIRQLAGRTFSMNVDDQSYLGRIRKITLGAEQLRGSSVIFGIGPQSSAMWHDNSIMRLLIDTGVAGLLCFSLAVLISIVNAYRKIDSTDKRFYFYILLVSAIVYAVNNLSTEFFLVTRSSFPFLILFGLLYRLIVDSIEPVTQT